jgi:hypothetical protein
LKWVREQVNFTTMSEMRDKLGWCTDRSIWWDDFGKKSLNLPCLFFGQDVCVEVAVSVRDIAKEGDG